MSSSDYITEEATADSQVTLGAAAGPLSTIGLGVGVVGLGAAAGLGAASGEHGMALLSRAFVVAACFFLTICAGSLFFVMIHHLVRARWSTVVRRVAENLTTAFPFVGLLLLAGVVAPALAGYDGLYMWIDPDLRHSDHLIHSKGAWFSPTFFAIRIVIYIAAWTLLSRYFRNKSIAQDASGDKQISETLRVASAPAILAFAFATAFFSFDILMSIDPRWFSTMFPVYFFAGCALSVYSTIALFTMYLQGKGKLTKSVNAEHYHDLGKFMFGFIFFWGYVAFSQFMLIWYADLPEETMWFHARFEGGWQWVSVALLFVHFIMPFLMLMSRHPKRRKATLAILAVWCLVAHALDLFWIVFPSLEKELNGGVFTTFAPMQLVTTLVAIVGVGGFFIFAVARGSAKVPLLPVKDPNLRSSLQFENI